jgi:hypothetical protein
MAQCPARSVVRAERLQTCIVLIGDDRYSTLLEADAEP